MQFEAHKDLFIEEAHDLLRDMESPLLELEKYPDNHDLIDSVFRAMHTIKGSSSMFGFTDITEFTHDIESTFDLIRNGKLSVTSELIELTLAAKDALKELLYSNNSESEIEKRRMILSRYAELSSSSPLEKKESSSEQDTVAPSAVNESSDKRSYHIEFEPDPEILLRGVKILPLIDDIHSLGQIMVRASTEAIPPLKDFNPEYCYLKWDFDLATDHTENDIRNCFIFVEDYSKIKIEHIPEITISSQQTESIATVASVASVTSADSQDMNPRRVTPIIERRHTDTSSIRVKNDKLDSLVNLVGEMVTLHARLGQEAVKEHLPEFIAISENLGRLTNDLREIAMSVRMVPLAETLSSFTRLVHDLSKTLGKKIRLETEGGETELDKNVIEMLRDPLMHIIRNSVDHGIETPDIRSQKGKDETGCIHIRAEHSGANVRITISDDGEGLNRNRILTKAIANGLKINEDADDKSVYALIFEPGFSTAETTTDISGRGVGMDVVRRNMEKIRGSINISTVPDQSTSIVLTIPLTLAIIDGFMIETGNTRYIFNLSIVRECLAYTDSSDTIDNRGMFRLRDKYIPFVNTRSLFGLDTGLTEHPQIVVTKVDDNEIGFLVDKVIGHCQTVIKPLGKGIHNAKMFSGATILGDGSIALIIDVNQIINTINDGDTMA